MLINPFKIKEYNTVSIRSRVKFIGNFYHELKLTIDIVEEFIDEELDKHFKIASILSGKNNLKIRIKDDEKGILRLVNCAFKYDNTDVRYGNIKLDLISSELSQKPRVYFVGKFNVLERDKIKEKLLADLIIKIKEVY